MQSDIIWYNIENNLEDSDRICFITKFTITMYNFKITIEYHLILGDVKIC